jgi:hypothetical protein
MARRNRKVSVRMYCVMVEVVQPVKRIVICVDVENTAGILLSIVEIWWLFECRGEGEGESWLRLSLACCSCITS